MARDHYKTRPDSKETGFSYRYHMTIYASSAKLAPTLRDQIFRAALAVWSWNSSIIRKNRDQTATHVSANMTIIVCLARIQYVMIAKLTRISQIASIAILGGVGPQFFPFCFRWKLPRAPGLMAGFFLISVYVYVNQ
jgi:hypothetical protein